MRHPDSIVARIQEQHQELGAAIASQTDYSSPYQPESPVFEIGLDSFAGLTPDPYTSEKITSAQCLENLIETIVLAEEVGPDSFTGTPFHTLVRLPAWVVRLLLAGA